MEHISGGNGRCLLLLALFVSMSAFASSQSSTSIYSLCPSLTGYYRSLMMAMDGSDGTKYTDLTTAQTACNAAVDCYGIGGLKNATEFYLKTAAVMPTRMDTGSCLYTKINPIFTSCPSAPNGYSVVYDVFPTSGFISTNINNINTASGYCDSLQGCTSFAWDGTTFSTYASVASQYKRFSCIYVKIETSCKSYPGYTVKPDFVVQNQWGSSTSGDGAYNDCRTISSCRGFDSNGNWYTAVVGTLAYSRGGCAHVKADSTVCADVAGYSTRKDSDYGATGTAIVASSDTLAANACTSDTNCHGFSKMQTSTGIAYTKRKIMYLATDYVYKYGSCYYTKTASGR